MRRGAVLADENGDECSARVFSEEAWLPQVVVVSLVRVVVVAHPGQGGGSSVFYTRRLSRSSPEPCEGARVFVWHLPFSGPIRTSTQDIMIVDIPHRTTKKYNIYN
jgi:hypothetical protein